MEKPVCLLAFANDQGRYLEMLKMESRRIARAFEPMEDANQARVHREESAETRDVLRALLRFDDRIVLFHYGGHADGAGLHLEGQSGQAEGLAQLLGRQSRLQFVFLNGCSTRKQVDLLLNAGVKAVIATTSTIDDRQAADFAGFFYEKLVNRGAVGQAFQYACDALQFEQINYAPPELKPVKVNRGIGAPQSAERENTLSWGLYYNQDQSEVLEWTLPVESMQDAAISAAPSGYRANDYLQQVPEVMAEFNEQIELELGRRDEREYFDLMTAYFPSNISSQLRRLWGPEEETLNGSRLRQLLSTYLTGAQCLYFVALSQLWDEKAKQTLPPDYLPIEEVFDLKRENFLEFDYINQFRRIIGALQERRIPLFIPAFSTLTQSLREESQFRKAILFLESIRGRLGDYPAGRLCPGICAETELHLALFLGELAFLVNYQMINVRDIRISNPKHLRTKFLHRWSRLRDDVDNLKIFKKLRELDDFLDSNAILLLGNLEENEGYLNLSPFLIDRHSYEFDEERPSQRMDLFFCAYAAPALPDNKLEYHFMRCSKNIFLTYEREIDRIHTGLPSKIERHRKSQSIFKQRKQKSTRPYAVLKQQIEAMLER